MYPFLFGGTQYREIIPPVLVLIVYAISVNTFKIDGTLPGMIETGIASEYAPLPAAFNAATLNEYRCPFVNPEMIVITAVFAPASAAVRISSYDIVNELGEMTFQDASGIFAGGGTKTPDTSVSTAYFIVYAYGTYEYGVGTNHDNFTFLPSESGIIVGIILDMDTFGGRLPIRENTTFGATTVIESASNSVVFVTGAGFVNSFVPKIFVAEI